MDVKRVILSPVRWTSSLRGVVSKLSVLSVCLAATVSLAACGKTPDSKPIVVPKAAGHRESTYGKAMDQAEDLKVKINDYNDSIEQAIDQGTNDKPPPKKNPVAPPPAPPE
jgi:hypothetical protein